MAAPPQYQDETFVSPDNSEGLRGELPAYERRPSSTFSRGARTEHTFMISGLKRSWATLRIASDAPSSAHRPVFVGEEPIGGTLEMRCGKGEHIQNIGLIIKGTLYKGAPEDSRQYGAESLDFLNSSTILWTSTDAVGSSDTAVVSPVKDKLVGDIDIPILFPMPREVSIKVKSELRRYKLAQTFIEKGIRSSVTYSLTILFRRGKFRTDEQINTIFNYVPLTRPGPPSFARQMAYQENSHLIGPEGDPQGWKTFNAINVTGQLFGNRPVHIRYTLSLATPLSYTKSTAIPCSLTIQCRDAQAFDLLSSAKSPSVVLRRTVRQSLDTASAQSSKTAFGFDLAVHNVQSAVWWPTTDGASSNLISSTERRTRLDGEIHLSKQLKPNTEMAYFSVSYSVVLLPPQVAGFAPTQPAERPLIEQPVEIATMFARGPRPVLYSPPVYEELREPGVRNHGFVV